MDGTEASQDESGAATPRRSIIATWTEVFADLGGLIRAESRLARLEISRNASNIGRESAKVVTGALFLLLAAIFGTVAAVVALAAYIGWLWALLAVMALCAVVGIVVLKMGINGLSDASLLPDESFERIYGDLAWLSNRAEPIKSESSAEVKLNEGN